MSNGRGYYSDTAPPRRQSKTSTARRNNLEMTLIPGKRTLYRIVVEIGFPSRGVGRGRHQGLRPPGVGPEGFAEYVRGSFGGESMARHGPPHIPGPDE